MELFKSNEFSRDYLVSIGYVPKMVGGIEQFTGKHGHVTVYYQHPDKKRYPYVLYQITARTTATILRTNEHPAIMSSYFSTEDGKWHVTHIPYDVYETTMDVVDGRFVPRKVKLPAGYVIAAMGSELHPQCYMIDESFKYPWEWLDAKNRISDRLAKSYQEDLATCFTTTRWGIMDWSDVRLLKLNQEGTTIGITTCSNADSTLVPYIRVAGDKQMKLHRYKVTHLSYKQKRKLVNNHAKKPICQSDECIDRYIESMDIDHRSADKFIICTEYLRLATKKENNIAKLNFNFSYDALEDEFSYSFKTDSFTRLSDTQFENLRGMVGVAVMRGEYETIILKSQDKMELLNIKRRCLEEVFGGFAPNLRYNFAPIVKRLKSEEVDFYGDLAFKFFITRQISEDDMVNEKVAWYVHYPNITAQLSLNK